MTREGKCDVCRKRKVKCDEVRPKCGGCSKRNRPCRYTYGKAYAFVDGRSQVTHHESDKKELSLLPSEAPMFASKEKDLEIITAAHTNGKLSLKSTRAAGSGPGSFRTFVLTHSRPGSLSFRLNRTPTNDANRLLQRWMCQNQMFAEDFDTNVVLTNWMGLLPQRIGHSIALDSALDCFLKSTVTYANRSSENVAKLYESNAKALSSIRKDLSSSGPGVIKSNVLIAIGLLHLVEVFVRASTGGYKYHQTGLLKLMQTMSNNGQHRDEVLDSMFYYCIGWDLMPAIIEGRNSFDNSSWLSIPAQDYESASISEKDMQSFQDHVKFCVIKIPRLVRLVKQVRKSPTDTKAWEQATNLAKEVYVNPFEPWFFDALSKGIITIAPSTLENSQYPLQHAFNFKALFAYLYCIQFSYLRNIVCGLILALAEISEIKLSAYSFNVNVIAADDVQSAQDIAMCTEYAMKSAILIPVNSVRQLFPLDTSFGAWDRLESRSSPNSADAEWAETMKRWCVEMYNIIGSIWGVGEVTAESLQKMNSLRAAR